MFVFLVRSRSRLKVRIDGNLCDRLRLVRARDGILEGDQIHHVIKDWLERKGVTLKAIARRTSVRRRRSRSSTIGPGRRTWWLILSFRDPSV